MKREEGMTLEYAREMAEALVELLASACQRIEIAGSIRRQKANPNDIEIVAIPKIVSFTMDFFDGGHTTDANELNDLCYDLLQRGVLEQRPDNRGHHCWGTGIKRAVFFRGKDYAPVDLFQVIEPRQWGVIYTIRTGPGDFNRLLVTSRRWGGGCPRDRKVAGGRVWFIDPNREDFARMPASKFARLAEQGEVEATMVPIPEEEGFFQQLGVPCWPPHERTVRRLREHLQQK
jgi:hypothetical protein